MSNYNRNDRDCIPDVFPNTVSEEINAQSFQYQ